MKWRRVFCLFNKHEIEKTARGGVNISVCKNCKMIVNVEILTLTPYEPWGTL